MEAPTFDNLPTVVLDISRKVDLILTQLRVSGETEQDRLFTIEQFIEYLPEQPARQTVYGWINGRRAPYEKHGKRLYFRKSAVETWLLNGRKMK